MSGPNGKFVSAKGSRLQIEGDNLTANSFDAEFKGDDLDTVNFECQGWDQGTIGIQGWEWRMGANWDGQQTPYTDPPGLFPRDNLGTLQAWPSLSQSGTSPLVLPVNRVLSGKFTMAIRDLVKVEASGKSNGVGPTSPAGNN